VGCLKAQKTGKTSPERDPTETPNKIGEKGENGVKRSPARCAPKRSTGKRKEAGENQAKNSQVKAGYDPRRKGRGINEGRRHGEKAKTLR